MSGLLFYTITPQVTKSEPPAKPNNQAIIAVGAFVVLLVAAALYLFTIKQTEAAGTVLGLAGTFLGFVSGRATGEKAGLAQNS